MAGIAAQRGICQSGCQAFPCSEGVPPDTQQGPPQALNLRHRLGELSCLLLEDSLIFYAIHG